MKLRKYLSFIIVICILSSCKNLYVQKSIFVPMLKEKGETKVEAMLGREGVSLNSAYAVTDNIGVMFNGFSAFDNSSQYDRKYNYNIEGGLGYHINFLDSFHFETYIGGGLGTLNSNYDRPRSDYDPSNALYFFIPWNFIPFIFTLLNNTYNVNGAGSYQTAFFQNTIGISSEGNAFSITARAQYIKFDKYREEIIIGNQSYWYYINVPAKIFIQPVLTDKINIVDNLNLVLQVGFNLDFFDAKEVFEWNKTYYSAGFEFNFNTLKNSSKKNKVTGL